jgi:NAD(P)-dependent dehydrogenase (short-subunit alcohol dehydrogenase family)
MQLKPISDQVVVVVGAGSGLGLIIARAAAKAGAAVVLADRDESAVRQAAKELTAKRGRAHPVVGDCATEEGCQRIGRAAAARFDRIDGWIDATGSEAGLAFAAEGLVKHMASRGGQGALVAFARRFPRAARAQLRKGRGAVAATLIALPRDWRDDAPTEAAVRGALYALTHPLGRMAVAPRGERLTTLTEASKHKGVIAGVGLAALAGAALWLGRGRISRGFSAAVPRRTAKPARPRRTLKATKLEVTGPRLELKRVRLPR